MTKSISDISKELIDREENDQRMRRDAQKSNVNWNQSIDDENESFLKKVVVEHGWPSIPEFGYKASNAAWVIVQHSSDTTFMEHCLSLMKAHEVGNVTLANIAYLEDRINMYNNRPQKYGTQWKKLDGELVLYKLQNRNKVEKYRKEMDLNSLDEDRRSLFDL